MRGLRVKNLFGFNKLKRSQTMFGTFFIDNFGKLLIIHY